MASPALRITGLAAGYPDAGRVLEGVDLSIETGESVALMGRNGMGKTTLLRAIMGWIRPQAGRVDFAGRNVTGWQPFALSHAGIAYVPQGREIFKDFSVEDNLRLGLIGKKHLPQRVPDLVYQRFPVLAQRRAQKAGTLSGGEQQQLAIARAIVGRPRLLLLDEPSEGIQPSIVHALGEAVTAIAREEGMSVLLVEQNLDLVLALTTRCLFMENGRIVAEGETRHMRKDSELLERYLSV
jgi:branched-chain amino acid transport system ATP-binding protein/urea transport system ATP-binding protein